MDERTTPDRHEPHSDGPAIAAHVVLMGARGCGKTTIGSLLAARLGIGFVDLDEAVLRALGAATVREAWAAHGEAGWREAEGRVLPVLLADTPKVIALGGGAPTVAAVRAALDEAKRAGRARVVYLRCRPETLRRRLTGEVDDRPSLTGRGALDEIELVLHAREPIYCGVATHVVDGDELSPEVAGQRIARFVVGDP